MEKVKRIFTLLLVTLSISLSVVPTLAIERSTSVETEVSMRAEESEWKYRLHNGQRQKRLWSNTKAEWLTDWMPV